MDKQNGLKVGDILYKQPYSRNGNNPISEHKIVSFGRIYFEIEGGDKIRIDTLRYSHKDYSQFNYQLYRTRKEIEDKNEADKIWASLRGVLNCHNNPDLSLEQIKAIHAIINPQNT